MAYTPTEWKNGEVITAEKLNNLEEGVQEALEGDGEHPVFLLTARFNQQVDGSFILDSADKTFNELAEAYTNGKICFAKVIYVHQGGQTASWSALLKVELPYVATATYNYISKNSGSESSYATITSYNFMFYDNGASYNETTMDLDIRQ